MPAGGHSTGPPVQYVDFIFVFDEWREPWKGSSGRLQGAKMIVGFRRLTRRALGNVRRFSLLGNLEDTGSFG